MRWVWDKQRSRINKLRRGLSFKEAELVFDDAYALSRRITEQDQKYWYTIGRACGTFIITKHTKPVIDLATGRENGLILAARRVTANEKMVLFAFLHPTEHIRIVTPTRRRRGTFEDIPEVLDWRLAELALFYRSSKQSISLRLDADLLDWFRHDALGRPCRHWHNKANTVLRNYVRQQERHGLKNTLSKEQSELYALFYRTIKCAVTLHCEEAIIRWFKREGGEGYQTRINVVLRRYFEEHRQPGWSCP